MKKCTFPDCNRDHAAKGYCTAHYYQWRSGGPLRPIGIRGVRVKPAEPKPEIEQRPVVGPSVSDLLIRWAVTSASVR